MNKNIFNAVPAVGAFNEPAFMDTFLASGYLICALFGIVLNMAIIIFIVFRRRLRRQPRNIIWLGIGLSNIFVFLFINLEPIGFYFSETTELCRVHYFLVGFPGAAFLMYNLLSLIDRYISIFRPVWYRRCVTVRLVLAIQLAAFIILFFLMKSHYIFGFVPVKCDVVQPPDQTLYIGFIVFFLVLCLTGQLTLYTMIKKHLVLPSTHQSIGTNGGNNTTTNDTAPTESGRIIQPGGFIRSRYHPSTDHNDEIITPEEAVKALGQRTEPNNVIRQNLHFVRIRYQIVSRLELEATRNVIFCVGISLLFLLPWIVSSVLSLNCDSNITHRGIGKEETIEALIGQCSRYYWANSYTKLLSLVGHCIYQLVCYVSRSKDFCAGLGRVHGCRRINGYCWARKHAEKLTRQPHQQRMRKVHRRPM